MPRPPGKSEALNASFCQEARYLRPPDRIKGEGGQVNPPQARDSNTPRTRLREWADAPPGRDVPVIFSADPEFLSAALLLW